MPSYQVSKEGLITSFFFLSFFLFLFQTWHATSFFFSFLPSSAPELSPSAKSPTLSLPFSAITEIPSLFFPGENDYFRFF